MRKAQTSIGSKWVTGLLSLIYPSTCLSCYSPLYNHEIYLCKECYSHLALTGYENLADNPVAQLFWGRVPLEFAASLFFYRKGETIQQLIKIMKYRGEPEAGVYLGQIAGKLLNRTSLLTKPDYIMPVPLHPAKERKRGYNQCEKIAEGMSPLINSPVDTTLLFRRINNSSQTTKSRYERWENVDTIFGLNQPEEYKGSHILLIDDVITTGSTIEACCHALLAIPDLKISVVSIAYSH